MLLDFIDIKYRQPHNARYYGARREARFSGEREALHASDFRGRHTLIIVTAGDRRRNSYRVIIEYSAYSPRIIELSRGSQIFRGHIIAAFTSADAHAHFHYFRASYQLCLPGYDMPAGHRVAPYAEGAERRIAFASRDFAAHGHLLRDTRISHQSARIASRAIIYLTAVCKQQLY